MCLLIETISCVDGKLQNLFWHTVRVNKSRGALFNSKNKLSLENTTIPDFVKSGKWKCRLIYNERIHGVSFEPYRSRDVKTLRVIESEIKYCHKYEDRNVIDSLYQQKGDADEILIIKNGLVTDTSIANVLLYDGKEWVTPEKPLLEGTMRAELLSKQVVAPKEIEYKNLLNYKKIMLVNAMNPFDESKAFSLSHALKY